jgi:hypothetical protein
MGTGALSHGVNLHLSKNMRIYTATSPYVLMAQCLQLYVTLRITLSTDAFIAEEYLQKQATLT